MLGKEIVTLDFKKFSSYRIKIANIQRIPYHIWLYHLKNPPSARTYLEQYFAENQDNPYGLWNAFLSLMPKGIINKLTQFPPLHFPKDAAKQKADIERMRELALPGDSFFTYDRRSRLSRLIRNWDKGMWSHVGSVGYNKTLREVSTFGPLISDFNSLCIPSLDVGLYRLEPAPTDEQVRIMIDASYNSLMKMKRFAWYRVIRIGLQNKFHIPYKRGPNEMTPADLIYSNNFRLVCYA